MVSKTVLLVDLRPAENQQIRELLLQFSTKEAATFPGGLSCAEVSTLEEALSFGALDEILLVVAQVDATRKKFERDIHHFKCAIARPVPLMLLVPPELGRNIKDYLRAGADEYWILPIDAAAFSPRLYVLLELGQSMMDGGMRQLQLEQSGSLCGSFWRRMQFMMQGIMPRALRITTAGDASRLLSGRWHNLKRLGFGSFGEVCLVRQEGEETLAVAKIPHDPKLNSKFLREAAILTKLADHPNAVHLKEVIKEEGKVVLIQEYVEGATLHDIMAEGMDSAAKERAFLELLEVMAYAHQQNIMHRDIKPENIIITPAGNLKLLDFGTSKDLSRNSISKTVIGSRPYMAPEQIMGKSRIASDVWALGVILYSLATDFLPFYDVNEKQLMDAILETEPERPSVLQPELPAELEAIILKCLRKEWSERYPNAIELRDDLIRKFPNFGAGKILA